VRAVVLRELGDAGNLRVEEWPMPVPGPGEVVVRVRAASLNHRDVWIRRGQYAGIRLPAILGSDATGEVTAAGDADGKSWLGREVVIDPSLEWGPDLRAQGGDFHLLGMPTEGTYAEFVKVPAANVYAKPSHLTLEEAAALPLASVTAYRALVTRAAVQAGEIVVITGIGGGVALAALTIAVSLGATVYVTSGSETVIDQIEKQLGKLVDVVELMDMTKSDHIERELALFKLHVTNGSGAKLAPIIEQFGARVLSDTGEHYTVELVGGSQDIDRFLKRSAQIADVVTLVRSGAMAVMRGAAFNRG